MNTIPRPRVLTLIELAIETGALLALRYDVAQWPEGTSAAFSWANIVAGLREIGAIGYTQTYAGYRIVYELFPDDSEHYGLCGDGKGDLFSVPRDAIISEHLFS